MILCSFDPILISEESVSVLDNLLPFSFDAPKNDDDTTKDVRSMTRFYVMARGASMTLTRVAAADWNILNTEEVLAKTVFRPLKA
jgi:hypothetical protein